MAKKSVIARAQKTPKYSTRIVRRCFRCGRKRGYIRDFCLCRICFRELANKGQIPGIKKRAGNFTNMYINSLIKIKRAGS